MSDSRKFKFLFFVFTCLVSAIISACSTADNEIVSPATGPLLTAKSDFVCIYQNTEVSIKVETISKDIVGTWDLRRKEGFRIQPQDVVSNTIRFKFDKFGLAEVYENGKLSFLINYKVIQKTANNVQFVSIESDPSKDKTNILNGTIRICDNELVIDQGLAFDAPAYFFKKVAN
ncbi:MAG: hypothetical protein ACRCVT_11640 [Leadbetterella sp.]